MNGSLMPWIASILVLAGALFSLLGAIGVSRLPDCYTRMHAASKAGALGAVLILAGAAAASGGETALEAILALSVLLATAPLAAHAVSRAAWRAGFKPIIGPLGNALDTRPQSAIAHAPTRDAAPAAAPNADGEAGMRD